jgi:hypothetical protein
MEDHSEMELPYMDFDEFFILIRWMYLGQLDQNVPESVVETAYEFGLNHLAKLVQNLTTRPHSFNLGDLFDNEIFSDATLQFKGIEVFVHRCILAPRCSYFDDLFKGNGM